MLTALGAFALPSLSRSADLAFERADISFIPWDIETRQRLTPADVRSHAHVVTKIVDSDEVQSLLKWLRLDNLRQAEAARPEDARLVVDLFDQRETRSTYYAGRFRLVSVDELMERSIDSVFKQKFTFTTP